MKKAAEKLAFETAIDTALHHEYSIEQVKEIFSDVMKNYEGNEEGE